MKKNLFLYGAMILISSAVSVQVLAIDSSDEENQVKAPEPIKFPTHGYVPEASNNESRQGELFFKKSNCLQCHSVKNAGGIIGPMLDGIGRRRSEDFLFAHLCQSRNAQETYFRLTGQNRSNYVHPRLRPEVTRSVVAFLMTLPEPEGGFILTPHIMSLPAVKPKVNISFRPEKQNPSSMQGEKLFNNKGCIACHSVRNVGGWLGPKLDGVGGRLSRNAILENITNPARVNKSEVGDIDILPQMPKVKLTKEQSEQLTDYLLTLPNSDNEE